jgi:EAL domain-containing protein (putative c-di-GMP-specific phosphodiesterase class I)
VIARTMLHRLLEPDGLVVLFQPIVRRHESGWRLHALEALVRGPSGTNMESAEVLFEYVRRKREESLIDRECVGRALWEARGLAGEPALAINVHASTLGRDRDFVAFLADTAAGLGVAPTRITIEIVEHAPAWEGHSFARALSGLRELGVRVALDDIGLGHSNYRMILECQPDCFKIDRFVVSGAAGDARRRAVLRSVAGLAHDFGAQTVAEGVETEEDLGCVLALGIPIVQGFLFSAPLPARALAGSSVLGGGPLHLPDSAGGALTLSAV